MHLEVLNDNQKQLLPLIGTFNPQFGLVGGTAIALHLGHRRSIDFDLFTLQKFDIQQIRTQIRKTAKIENTFTQGAGELTVLVNQVRLTFYHFPYPIKFSEGLQDIIKVSDLITLGAMKAFALGKRAKWKDYVDLFFLLKQFSLVEIVTKTNELFSSEFNEKLFRIQLSYFKDIDRSEDVFYMPGYETDQEEIEEYLEQASFS